MEAWSKGLSTGDAAIDAEHKELLDRLAAFAADPANAGIEARLLELLAFVEQHVVDHFQREEERMTALDYPGRASHEKEHQDLIDYITRVRTTVSNAEPNHLRNPGFTQEYLDVVTRMLTDWLRAHVLDADRALAHFMRGRG